MLDSNNNIGMYTWVRSLASFSFLREEKRREEKRREEKRNNMTGLFDRAEHSRAEPWLLRIDKVDILLEKTYSCIYFTR